jgi:hypothetical protein
MDTLNLPLSAPFSPPATSPMRVPSGVFGLGKTSLSSSSSLSRDDDILSRWNTPAKDSPFLKVNVPRPSLSPWTHSPL